MRQYSLKGRLLRLIVIPLVLGLAAVSAFSYYNTFYEADEIYDAQLVHFAKILLLMVHHEIEESDATQHVIVLDEKRLEQAYEFGFAYRVWMGGTLILHSSNAGNFGKPVAGTGFSEQIIDNQKWHFFVLKDHEATVEIAEKMEIRDDLIDRILTSIFLPQLLVFPLTFLVIWWGVLRGIKPIEAISHAIKSRNSLNLEPIAIPVVPVEMVPMVDEVNNLLMRLKGTLEKEKNFTNYAAHELRTPLAALKTQAQVIIRMQDPKKRDMLLQDMAVSVDRMSHLVEQLLTYSRVQKTNPPTAKIDMSALVMAVIQDMLPQAIHKQIHLSINIEPEQRINANEDLMLILIRNLVDNAIKYTPCQGRVWVGLCGHTSSEGKLETILSVKDNGPGIPVAERPRIVDSFYRLPGSMVAGCGLGLAIVKWIVELHNASMRIMDGDSDQGTCFEIAFNA